MILMIRSVLNRIIRNPLRSTLTITNIALGVAVLTLIFNISFRLNDKIRGSSVKDAHVIVIANASYSSFQELRWENPSQFRPGDEEIIKNSIDTIKYITPLNLLSPENRIKVGNTLYRTGEFLGTGKDYAKIYGLKIVAGSFITEDDISAKNCVAVISESAAGILFENPVNAIGKTFTNIRLNKNDGTTDRRIFKITGVFSDIPPGKAEMYRISDYLIPYSLYNANNNRIRIFAAKTNTGNLKTISAGIKKVLSDIHGYGTKVAVWEGNPKNPDNPHLKDMKAMSEMVILFMGPLGMIILLVSSFGIFSMMMVSILENTREIGLRRTLGATKNGVVVHFIFEALLFSFTGSLIGILLAFIFNKPVIGAMEPILAGPGAVGKVELSSFLDMKAVLFSFSIAQLTGAVFGLFPAVSAAGVSPVESLREG